MVLTKTVNGIRTDMSVEEEAEIRAMWAASDIEKKKRDAVKEQKKTDKAALLSRLGISQEEADLLLEKV